MPQVSVRVGAARALKRRVFGRRVIPRYHEHLAGDWNRLADRGGRLSPRDLFRLHARPCGAVLHFFLSLRLVDIPPGDRGDQLSQERSLQRDRGSMATRLALQLFPGCLAIL